MAREFFSISSDQTIRTWMVGEKPAKAYFYEHLPACFSRALQFDHLGLLKGTLEWVFTGERGGFSVSMDDSSVNLCQRFYDSFGLHDPQEFPDKDPSLPLKY